MSLPHIELPDVETAVAWLRQHAGASARLCSDSRTVAAGDVFLAWPGRRSDARRHLAQALQAGAVAVLVERDGCAAAGGRGDARVACLRGLQAASGEIASLWHGRPGRALDVVAVTGTNGKTTLSWWLAHVLSASGRLCGYVGTLGAGIVPEVHETGLTSPDALQLQQLLADFRARGALACALEASSIGLEQGRLAGTDIRVAAFTNLTQDHLDYHGTMQAYASAKERLFSWPGLQAAVLNLQDAHGLTWHAMLRQRGDLDVWGYAVQAESPAEPARLLASEIRFAAGATEMLIRECAPGNESGPGELVAQAVVRAPVSGMFNVQNLLALIGVLRALGLPLHDAARLCASLPPVPGRMQTSAPAGKPMVVVDYAHTPDALRAVLAALKPVASQRGGRVVAVFGCGGDRDTSKRPLMAMAAAQQADQLWITSDNPRSEDPRAIIEQIGRGLTQAQHRQAHIEVDRRSAIAQAITRAQAADVVLVAGKGHEPYQEIKGRRLPFSDADEVATALAAWAPEAGAEDGRKAVV